MAEFQDAEGRPHARVDLIFLRRHGKRIGVIHRATARNPDLGLTGDAAYMPACGASGTVEDFHVERARIELLLTCSTCVIQARADRERLS